MPTESKSVGFAMGGRSFARLRGTRCFLLFRTFLTLESAFASRIPLIVGGSARSLALMSTMSSPSMTPARACLSLRNMTRCTVFSSRLSRAELVGHPVRHEGPGLVRDVVAHVVALGVDLQRGRSPRFLADALRHFDRADLVQAAVHDQQWALDAAQYSLE